MKPPPILLDLLASPPAGEAAVWVLSNPLPDAIERLAARMLGIPDVQITRDQHGCPAIAGHRAALSTARRGELIAIALAPTGRIGVDLELPCPDVHLHVCSSAERAHLESLPHAARPDAFLHMWTAKEAAAKAIGLGISVGLDQIDVLPSPTAGWQLARMPAGGRWNLQHHRLPAALLAVVWA